MPLANIIDRRKRTYCSCPINAVIEPSCADNGEPSADQYDADDPNITTNYEERPDTSIYLAVNWANEFSFPVTLYIYDFELDEEQQAAVDQVLEEIRQEVDCLNDNTTDRV